jgi:hypothetical protein
MHTQKSLFTSSEEDCSMAIETSATQQSRRPRHNPENNNPINKKNTQKREKKTLNNQIPILWQL